MNFTNMESDNLNMKMLKPLDEVLRCPICSEFFNNCVMSSCSHDFCSACLKKRMTTESDCPICYEDLRESDLRNNDSMDKIVRIYKKLTSLDFLFCAVEFSNGNQSPSVVPSAWLENDNEVLWCWFPTKDVRKHVLKRSSPEDGWDLFQAHVLHFSREWKDSQDYLKQYQKGSSFKTSKLENTPKKLKTSLLEETRLSTAITSSSTPQTLNMTCAPLSASSNLSQTRLLSCGSCATNSDFIDKVMKRLDHMSEEISGVKKTLAVIADGLHARVEKIEIVGFPLENESGLSDLEYLIENREEFGKYVKYLGRFGGRNVKESTRRILAAFINDSFALKMNWVGGNGKIGLKYFPRVLQLITAAVQETPATATAKQLEVEEVAKKWLRCASDRNGGRKKRRKFTSN